MSYERVPGLSPDVQVSEQGRRAAGNRFRRAAVREDTGWQNREP